MTAGSSNLTEAKINIKYIISEFSLHFTFKDSPGFLIHRCQALYKPACSAHTDAHYILGKRNFIHSWWQHQPNIY